MSVISLAAEREARLPHMAGTFYCVGCQHEWVGVAPIGLSWAECPNCHLPKGTPKYPFGGQEGDAVLTCDCGCEALTAYKRERHWFVKCMGCGNDLTEAFYDG